MRKFLAVREILAQTRRPWEIHDAEIGSTDDGGHSVLELKNDVLTRVHLVPSNTAETGQTTLDASTHEDVSGGVRNRCL